MVFYDFEVFKYDWLVVIIKPATKEVYKICNNKEELERIFDKFSKEIWVGYNNNHYDKYIMQGILSGFNPKEINDFIIEEDKPGFLFSDIFKYFNFINYDTMLSNDRGLKYLEGSAGNSIKETSVSFDIERPLTEKEIEETFIYCTHDVEQTIYVFLKRQNEFIGKVGLVKLAGGNPNFLSLTNPRLTAIILNAKQKSHDDEFNIDFPDTLRLKKYREVLSWYQNTKQYTDENGHKMQLKLNVAGIKHIFGFGGLHAAKEHYSGKGIYINMDVTSLYPSLMIEYHLQSRNIRNKNTYVDIYKQRLEYKKQKNPMNTVLKLVLNSTYGAMKDKNNPLFDPLQSNKVCIYGQLLMLDLIEKLEDYCELVQTNTDGILIKVEKKNIEKIMLITEEWQERVKLKLEYDYYIKVFQKDVNNYIVVDKDGNYKAKGILVKKLTELDNGNIPILNEALKKFMVENIPIEDTILNCNDMKKFQLIVRISKKYDYIIYGNRKLNERCIRVFASKDKNKPGVAKVHKIRRNLNKIENTPENCTIYNDDMNSHVCLYDLDKNWYINKAKEKAGGFGIDVF